MAMNLRHLRQVNCSSVWEAELYGRVQFRFNGRRITPSRREPPYCHVKIEIHTAIVNLGYEPR
jgi:hypothetical protein